jgi:hypothetical protein
MPRKNVFANLTVLEGRATRLSPPPYLSPREVQLFIKIVNDCEAKHFRPSDEPQLVEYVKASIASEDAHDAMMATGGPVGDGEINPYFKVWEKLARRMAIQGTRLRLTPASRIRPEAVQPKKKGFTGTPSYYDTMDDEDDEDDASSK